MIKALPFIPYTDRKDYIADSTDLAELPHNCGDGSTCIMRDTGTNISITKKRMSGNRRNDQHRRSFGLVNI